jgi:hypothetical protein
MLGPREKSARIEEAARRHGGWEKILAPQYEPTEELLVALEEAGLSRRAFASQRKWYALSPRERKIKEIAGALWSEWQRYLDAERGRDAEAPHVSGRRFIDVPTGFWQYNAQRLQEDQISEQDIVDEILNHPDSYRPLIPIWTRMIQARDERRRQGSQATNL